MNNGLYASCDEAAVEAADSTREPRHPRLIIASTILASTLALIDGSVVNVGLPAISASLHADISDLQWIVNAYLLPLSALILLGGAAGDRYGRKRLLIAGVTLFALASLACALAWNLSALFVARFVQGVSAAMLMPNSLAILGQSFSGEAKGRAIGIWAAVGAAAAAIGPVLGGWLIDASSWRLIFLINLPLAAAAIALTYISVDADQTRNSAPLDLIGGLLATAGLGITTWALTRGSAYGWSPLAFATLCAGALLLAGFVLFEHQRGNKAMMPLALFGSPSFVGLTLLTFLLYGALGGLFVAVPYVLITAGGYSATGAGAALLPLPLVIALASPFAGAFAAKSGPRVPLALGPIIVALGFLLLLRMGRGEDYWRDVFPAIVVIATGMAMSVAPLTTAVLMSVDAAHVGAASGFNSAVARNGGLVATALIGSVLVMTGPALLSAMKNAAVAGALACVAASFSAFLLIAANTRR